MPEITELPTTTKALTPGWSYVVDTGYDPSKVAINPSSRKRLRTTHTESASDLSLRQQTAITRYLAELDKDSHRDVQIAVPKSNVSAGKKQSTNVKRVLGSGKTFQHYLEEEEARAALRGDEVRDKDREKERASKTPLHRRKNGVEGSKEGTPSGREERGKKKDMSAKTVQVQVLGTQNPESIVAPVPEMGFDEEEIEELIAGPGLGYGAARAAAPKMEGRKHRVFCEICGYWGRAKCV
ncbi:hypothetical protein CAC42_425 [Sphaceloma murrayae]|uniref:Uncharacterized protein n=1 Tax=Sphaceloma murrayae TaxID=2082308 RepID=A0A2K1R3H0_9PEZI|nr:hypothetical protein CAC42_425 [Sphaceloma murrayae]